MLDYEIAGSKGGSQKPHTPVETPNNLLSVAYAKVLIAVAEGELAGNPTAQDIFLDGTPLANADGSLNFGGVKWEWRSGSSDQEYIAGLPEVSTEYSVGVELKQTTPWTRQITKTQLDAVRVTFQWPALMEQQSNGDTVGISMDYAIDVSTDGGAFVEYQKYTIDGKTNTTYERTHRVDLPKANTGWTIRARRVTAESESSTIQDTINVKTYAEVVDVKQRYPNTALLYVEFDSRLFGGGNIPKVSVRTKGRIIQVPSNYDPETRTYSGVWSGAFKWAWTDNPAWVFYDLVTQNRFGLGHKVDATMIDKWSLYEVAQYCDVLVDDGTGSGTKEPRHTCNIYIQDKADAWKVLRDIANIFNGMTYWDGNQFVAVADKEEDISNIPVFSRSNVVDGVFTYQAADDKSIYTSALVSYDDPDNHYNTEVEATFETSQILRWGGDRQVELTAVGCTSRGEAQRKGKYTLITNMYNRSVTFQTGLQGLDDKVLPGKVIHVVDPLIGGKPFTGRIRVATGRVITLDRDIEAVAGDILYMTRKDGSSEGRTIEAVAGNIVTVTVAYSELPEANAVWYLESTLLKSQLFRVVKITSPSESVFEIEAVEYNESKFGAIDNGARLEPRPISVTPPGVQATPASVVVTSNTFTEQTMAVTTMTISWPQTKNATLYEGQWKVGNGEWVTLGTTGALQFSVKGIFTGDYVARVRAINAMGVKSIWTQSEATRLNGKVGGVPALASIVTKSMVFGIGLKWEFPNGATDTDRTEIMYSENPNFASAIKLGDFSYPTDSHELHGLKAGQEFWFWGRLIDRTGNIGPWTPIESEIGSYGISSIDQTEYQEYFENQIGESALYQELNDRIDLIDGPASLPGSVNERVKEVKDTVDTLTTQVNQDIADINSSLAQSVSDLNTAIAGVNTEVDAINVTVTGLQNQLNTDIAAVEQSVTDLNTKVDQNVASLNQQVAGLDTDIATVQTNLTTVNNNLTTQINGVRNDLQSQIDSIEIVSALPYDPTKTYLKGQIILGDDGILYQAAQSVPINMPPPNTTYWLNIGQAIADAGAVAGRVTQNELDIENLDGRTTANSTSITALQTQVNGKADATALTSLTTRVTTAEGKIETQGQAITGLTTTVNGKADTSALNALTTRVTAAEGEIDANTSAITNLTTTVNGKADASAVTALTTRMTTAEGKIDANTSAVTSLNATVGAIGGNGTNLIPAEYTVFTDTLAQFVPGSGITISAVADAEAFNGYALRMNKTSGAGTVYFATGNTYATANMTLKNKKYIASLWAKSTGANKSIAVSLRTINSAGTVVFVPGVNIAITGTWARYSVVLDATNATTYPGDKMVITVSPATTADNIPVLVDRVMLEEQIGTSSTPSAFTPGTSFTQATANAAATQALTARVTQTENDIDAQAQEITNLTTTVAGKADSAALSALTTRVTTAEGKIDSQAQSITNLNTSLTTTNNNVTAAQNAANAANTLAGGKGKVIYGSTTPVAADRLDQNIWIDTTNGANTPKRWNGSAWVAVTDKVATDAANAAANALSQVATKADASAVTALTTRVTTVEGKVDSQATSITDLNSSLTTTNNNVTAAQNAADAANTLAGGKGKVIYGSTTPAVADRLTQNIWIDTTGNANTPKRWNGSAWVAVTDKVATDAAAAAANALAQVATKADASAVTSLTTRVTTVEGQLDTQATQITNLTASLANVSGENLLLDPTFANSNGITSVPTAVVLNRNDASVPTGAPSARVVKIPVTSTSNYYVGFTSAANVRPPENTNISQIAVAAGEVYDFELYGYVTSSRGQVGIWVQFYDAANASVGHNWAVQSGDGVNYSTAVGQWVKFTGQATVPANVVRMAFTARFSAAAATDAYVSSPVVRKRSGQENAQATATQSLEARVTSAEGTITSQGSAITSLTNTVNNKADASALTALTTRVTTAEGKIDTNSQSITSLNTSLTTTNNNVTAAQNAANAANTLAGGKGKVIYGSTTPAVADRLDQNIWIDTTGGNNTPKRWNGSAWVAVTDKVATDAAAAAASALAQVATKADASAVTALTTRVTTAEGKIDANTQSITNLSASIGNSNSENIVLNSEYKPEGIRRTRDTSAEKIDYINFSDAPAGAPQTTIMRHTKVAAFSGWGGFAAYLRNGDIYEPCVPGEVINLECQMFCETNLTTNGGRIAITFWTPDGITGIGGNQRLLSWNPTIGGWQKLSAQATAPAGAGRFHIYYIPNDGVPDVGAKMYVGNLKVTRQTGEAAAAATAVQSLTARVTTAEGTISSQSTSITNLTGRMTTAEGNITANTNALSSLQQTVTNQGNTITAQGQSITSLTATVGGIGGKGSNLVPAEYAVFGATTPALTIGSGQTATTVVDAGAFNGYALQINKASGTGTIYFTPASTYSGANMGFKRAKYIASFYAKSTGANKAVACSLRTINSAGTVRFVSGQNTVVTNTWARYSFVFDATSSTFDGDKMAITITSNTADNIPALIDRVMLEEMIGTSTEPSAFVIGDSSSVTSALGTALQSLTTRVTSAEGNITSQSSALTALKNSLGGSGNNLLPAEYSAFTATKPNMVYAGTVGATAVDSEAFNGYAYKVTTNSTNSGAAIYTTPVDDYANYNMACQQGKYILSYYAKAETAGHTIALFVRTRNSAGSAANSSSAPQDALTTSWVRYSQVVDLTGATFADKDKMSVGIQINRSGVTGRVFYIDKIMLEKQVGDGTSPSAFTQGNSFGQVTATSEALSSLTSRVTSAEGTITSQGTAITNLTNTVNNKADASALNALTTRVTAAEGTITSQGNAITSLTNTVSGKADTSALNALTTRVTAAEGNITSQGTSITNLTAGLNTVSSENLIADPTFASGNGIVTSAATVVLREDAPLGAPSARVVKWDVATSTGNSYTSFVVSANAKSAGTTRIQDAAVRQGDVYDMEVWMYSTTPRQHGVWMQQYDTANASITHTWMTKIGDGESVTSNGGVWEKFSGTWKVGTDCVRLAMSLRVSSGDATTIYISEPLFRKRSSQAAAQATALTALDARVTSAEGTITSQSSSITSLTNSLAGKADNSALTALTSRVTTVEGTVTAQGSAITQVQSTLGGIGGSGSNMNPSEWSVFGAKKPVTSALSGGLTYDTVADAGSLGGYALKFTTSVTSTAIACYFHTNNVVGTAGSFPISYDKAKYILSFYAKSNVAGHQIRGFFRYVTSTSTIGSSPNGTFSLTTDWVRYSVVIDMTGTAFSGNQMAVAFLMNISGVSGREIYIDRVMVEKQVGPSTDPSPFTGGTSYTQTNAQATAITQLNTQVTQQGDTITATANQVSTLQTTVNGHTSSIQTISSSQSTTDGKLNSMWAVKMQVNAQGQYVAAGIGLGIENGPAGLQSQFLVQADKFAVVNGVNGTVTAPFVVSGGQVFIREALITQAMIQNLIVGSELLSSAQTNWGPPVLQLSMGQGRLAVHHKTRSYTYTEIDNTGVRVYVDGVLRVRMGTW